MVKALSQEELFNLDLEGEDVTEGFWLKTLNDAYELFRANYIDLQTLDRVKNAYYNVIYNYPKGTQMSIALAWNKKGYWMLYQKIYAGE